MSGCRPAATPRAPVEALSEEPLAPAVWAESRTAPAHAPSAELTPAPVEPAPIAGPDEVLAYRGGEPVGLLSRRQAEAEGLWLLELGSNWVPLLFRSSPGLPHGYESVFVELANGRFPESPEGRRAAQDRYLEPHGIPPSIALLQSRFSELAERPCVRDLALEPLREFRGADWDEGQTPNLRPAVLVALQQRLACEGHLRGPPSGELDQETRRALEEFERRNRIYGGGSLRGETLAALRRDPLELERRALVRVLCERALLELGVIEDGSGIGAFPARGGQPVENADNLARRIEERIVQAFGLESVEGAERFYRRLTGVLENPHYAIAIDPVALPDYHGGDMELWVEIDRGDLYYEFPFDESGAPLDFRIERGPTMTLFVQDGERVRPLVQYPTTIGGWRVRRLNGSVFWQYKESLTGMRAWKRVVTAPVWLPPPSTPSETLVASFRRSSDGSEFQELNHNLIGPSFASAYGLVAAHHQRAQRAEGGKLALGGDDGIRTHGSSDYTSIWRTVSSGCHRLHNHLAMRLFNFVLKHRAHRRVGHLPTRYRMRVSTTDAQYMIDISRTGYQFDLERPLEVQVLPGRIRGALKHPLTQRVPAADDASAWPTIMLRPVRPRHAEPEPQEE